MARNEITGGRLFDLYARYVGEPQSRKDVYGYWVLIVGYVVGFAGIAAYLAGSGGLLETAITMAAIGLPAGLLGIVLLLPVERRGVEVSVIGAVVSLVAVAWFVAAYPGNWGVSAGPSATIIALYSVGVALVGGVAALVPVVTGERSFFFETKREVEGDHPEVVMGTAMRGALFAVYRTGADWTWRLIEQEALAESVDDYLSKLETEESVERIKEKVSQAGLLEIKHAAFRLYDAGEGWRWKLMRDDGSVVAEGTDDFESRDAAARSVNELKEYGAEAPILSLDGGAFEVFQERTGWHWRLLDPHRETVARSATPSDTREDVEEAMEHAASVVDGAGELAMEAFGVELYEDDDGWRWRLVDAGDDDVAASAATFGSQGAAETAVYDVLDALSDASVLDAGAPGYEVYEAGDGWRWRLVDDDGAPIARGHDRFGAAEPARGSASLLSDHAGEAPVVEVDDAAFEYYRAGDGWRWRLVTPDRSVVAESTQRFEDREAAERGVEAAKTQAVSADLIEFEEAAFQLYEHDGAWRWRLIDEDGNVMADGGEEHETRDGAATSMMTLKEHAPDADLIEIETAAFEFFQNEAGAWNWRLVDEAGQTTTEGERYHETKADAREAMERLSTVAEVAGTRAMATPTFQVYPDGDSWRWRFVHPDGRVVADGVEDHATRDEAETHLEETVVEAATAAPTHTVGTLAVELAPEGDRWFFRLVDGEREAVAESLVSYADRDAARAVVEDLCERAPDVPVFALRKPTFQLVCDDGWRFRLVDSDRKPLAESPGMVEDRDAAEAGVSRVRRLMPDASLVEFDGAAFEVHEEDGRWRWRLIDESEAVVAEGAQEYDSRDEAEDALSAVTAEVEDASVLEIDTAAFELYEDGGLWRWRLIDENGTDLAESLEAYESRGEARSAMDFVKEYAGSAPASVAE